MSHFKQGHDYRRKELHDQFGGNEQSGIANCAKHPIIFIFTGSGGQEHGYKDGWQDNGYFYYTGEGQEGDMSFTRGNKALRNHVENQKEVHLFEETNRSGYWQYEGQLHLVDFEYFQAPDSNGNQRRAIRFILRPVDQIPQEEPNQPEEPDDSNIPNDRNKPNRTQRQGLVTSRVGQGWYRSVLLDRWDRKCAVTGCDITSILIASHIVPWSQANDDQRLDVDNGILLSPALDALFDRHLISFDNNGAILIADSIDDEQQLKLGITPDMSIEDLSAENKRYLQMHREKFYEKN